MWFIRGVIEAAPKRRLSAHTKQQSFKLWREKAKKQKPEALHKHRSKIWIFFLLLSFDFVPLPPSTWNT